MKKTIALILSALLVLSLMTACGSDKAPGAAAPAAGSAAPAAAAAPSSDNMVQPEKLSIVTTIFPIYDWVMNILGSDNASAEVTMLLDNGVDLHSYQPTVDDIIRISGCDVFICVGGESDEWVDDALSEASNKEMAVIDLMEILGDRVKEEEIIEGMEAEPDHDHVEDHEHEDEHEEDVEYDEHVWLSLKNAIILCDEIAGVLGRADPAHAESYKNNASAYAEKLSALDEEYKNAVDSAAVKTVLFGDRFPFRYLTDDYGLNYYAAFVGCSAETEASFATIVFLADKTDELGLKAICQIESADGSIARTISENTRSKDQQILTFDSMQSVTSRDVASGASYLTIMEQNLEVLKTALQ